MKDPNLDEMWESFSSMVIHPEAPDLQIREMRKAFFGGSHALLLILQNRAYAISKRQDTVNLKDLLDPLEGEIQMALAEFTSQAMN